MRAMLIAGVCLVGLSGGALAQDRVVVHGPGARYPVPGTTVTTHQAPPPVVHHGPAPVAHAPYRRLARGQFVPPAYNTPQHYVFDWASYGLPQPPVGYNWVRYHDDAVLIDARGTVFDVQSGVNWTYAQDQYYADAAPYPPAPYPQGNFDPRLYQRRDDGLGGAAIGAVAGGALGAAVAGRGDRLGGALIGGGVGAITGYAVDRAEDRGRVPPPPPPYGAGYPPPPPPAYGGYAGGYGAPTVQTYTVPAGGSQVIYAGPGVTTVTVTTQPSVTTTTTTTEYHDEVVTYSRPAAKRVYRRPVHRSKYKTR
ncbi:RcnB family protein [Sphingomonas lenta]|nr:RcnB family protein [Sphingomonas lenta]